MIAKFIKNPVTVSLWWQKDKELLEACKEQLWECLRRLKKEDDEKELFRLQGKIEILQQVLDLEKNLNERITPNAMVKQRETSSRAPEFKA